MTIIIPSELTLPHDLMKQGDQVYCKVCKRTWKRNPKNKCPGVEVYSKMPNSLFKQHQLEWKNLKPKDVNSFVGVIYGSGVFECLYDLENTTILDPNLPPVYPYQDRGDLKFDYELRKMNLVPGTAPPVGVVNWWDKEAHHYYWKYLYRVEDCEWKAKDNYITKTTLKKKYLLSEGWIKRLGGADMEVENPHYKNAHDMQLFSRQRVEEFIANNAQEYAKWLEKRDKLVDHYHKYKDKITAKREQKKLCDRCKCGTTFMSEDKGEQFLCVVHTQGLESVPCPDFLDKNS